MKQLDLYFTPVLVHGPISFAVTRLAIHVENPTMLHWVSIKNILRYLIKAIELGLRYDDKNESNPFVYVDAVWASGPATRRSVSRIVTFMVGDAVYWYSRQQEVAALPSLEAECIGLYSGAKETARNKRLISDAELVSNVVAPTQFLTDNQGRIGLAENELVIRRKNHIDGRYRYTIETQQQPVISSWNTAVQKT